MYRIGSPMFENKRRYNTMQLQESNLAARQPQGATSVIQATTGEGLAQGPYVAARGGVEPTTLRTKGTDNIHLTNHAQKRMSNVKHFQNQTLFNCSSWAGFNPWLGTRLHLRSLHTCLKLSWLQLSEGQFMVPHSRMLVA